MRRIVLPTLALLALACGPSRPPVTPDLVPPVLLSADPSGNDVPVDAVFQLRFSEPIKRDTVFWPDAETGLEVADSVVLAAAEDEDYIVSAVSSPPISSTQRKKGVEAVVRLSDDGATIGIAPLNPLDGNRAYVIAISKKLTDLGNNKLQDAETKANETLVVRFTTAPAPDTTRPTAVLRAPAPKAVGVSLDLATVEVLFDEPMDDATWTPEAITLQEVETGARIVPLAASWVENAVLLDLPPNGGDGCGTLCVGKHYVLDVNDALTDLAGNPVMPVDPSSQTFTAAECEDTEAPRIAAEVAVTPSDLTAVVRWRTDETSNSSVQFVTCGSGTCPAAITGADSTCSVNVCALPQDETGFTCEHSVKLSGLTPTTDYSIVVVSADGGGREARSEPVAFRTLDPLPRIEINELFATPVKPDPATPGKFVSDTDQKFIELFNAGGLAVDFAPTGTGATRKAWSLARCSDVSCTGTFTNVWKFKPLDAAATSFAPGAFAVAHGKSFDAARMGLPAGTMELVNDGTATTVLSNGLTSTTAYAYALLTPDGIVVSTYGAHLGKPNLAKNNARSFERKDALLDDVASNWAASTAAMSSASGNYATPGARNSSSP